MRFDKTHILKAKPFFKGFAILVSMVFLIWYVFFSLPSPLFQKPTSTVVFSAEKELLGGSIASDGQWRFPAMDSIPEKVEMSVLYFEDEYFYRHFGFNPISLFRAVKQNLRKGGIHSGGSTITMQTIRLASGNPARTYFQKLKEIVLATRLEIGLSKSQILSQYISNAPFGGNVVGLEAATWRYFKRNPSELSWAEAATLAVLPNAPSLIYPGKNQEKLKLKRNRLLQKLFENNIIDEGTYSLAKDEELPQKPNPLPQKAPHLTTLVEKEMKGKKVISSIKSDLQEHVNYTIEKHHNQLKLSEIHNMACLVISIKSGEVVAYAGNTIDSQNGHANKVDIIQAPRSSGSILKPILYQKMLAEGYILPKTLLPDVPMNAFENYSREYEGAVPADQALARSLNLPAVHLLKEYGVAKFKSVLNDYGFQQFTKPSTHYGLSLIIGGGEITLWELGQAYANMARMLYLDESKKARFGEIQYLKNADRLQKPFKHQNNWATSQTFKALEEVIRPESETGWQNFNASKIAWKTGTSHGFRDAWAVGINPEYVVAVWVGNADGEGRPNMTGTKVAAPVLFEVFDFLKSDRSFPKLNTKTYTLKVCKESSFLWSKNCGEAELLQVPSLELNVEPCSFHQEVFLDQNEAYRVNSSCYALSEMKSKNWFILPPQMAWYYQKKHPSYTPAPTFMESCISSAKGLALIYPKELSKIYIPKNLSGEKEKVIFEAVHADKNATLFWQIDNDFIGQTKFTHKIELSPSVGSHQLTISDESGFSVKKVFRVVE